MVETKKLSNRVFLLKDRLDCYANLILGSEKALLFDTGSGADDLKAAVEEITSLPLLVIASHGHFDHIGGSNQFDTVYMSKKDRNILESLDIEKLREWIDKDYDSNEFRQVKDLDFDRFTLGNIEGIVVEMPGHTRGSVGVYLPELKLLLCGDALTPIMCLFFMNHGTVEDELNTIKMVQSLDITHFLTAHSDKLFSVSILERMKDCLINSKGKRSHKYKYPRPPFSEGYFYLHSMEDEPVGVITEERQ